MPEWYSMFAPFSVHATVSSTTPNSEIFRAEWLIWLKFFGSLDISRFDPFDLSMNVSRRHMESMNITNAKYYDKYYYNKQYHNK